jgi:hypothetical protein
MEYIWSRSLSGPKWNTLTPRKFNIDIKNNNWEIYNNPKSSIEEKKCLVNMEKQTMRYGIPLFHDSRIRYEKNILLLKKIVYYIINLILKNIIKHQMLI